MTVSGTDTKWAYTGDGATKSFAYGARIADADHLDVWVDDVPQTRGTDYSVTNVGVDGGGNVVFVAAPASAADVVIALDLPLTQTEALPKTGRLPSAAIESSLDKLTRLVQILFRSKATALRLDDSDPATAIDPIPTAAARKGKLLGFDSATAAPVALLDNPNTILTGSGAPASSLGQDGDLYVDTDANEIYGPKAAGAWGAARALIPGFDIVRDTFTGDGTTTYGPVSVSTTDENAVLVYLDGVYQDHTSYTLDGTNVAFDTAVGTGVAIDVVFNVGGTGPAGPGLPAGGTAGQIATKASATDFDTQWSDPAAQPYKAFQIAHTADTALATKAAGGTQIGATLAGVTIPAAGFVRLTLLEIEVDETAGAIGRFGPAIDVGGTKVWPAMDDTDGAAFELDWGPIAASAAGVFLRHGIGSQSADNRTYTFDIAAAGFPTGTRDVTLFLGDGTGGSTGEIVVTGTSTPARFVIEIVSHDS